MTILKLRLLPVALCLALLGMNGVQAADDPNIARMWVITPKAGMDQQLEDAMKAHNKWRVDNGDPWRWDTFHKSTGDDLDSWTLRSFGHTYADLDAYGDSDFGKQAYENWLANVDPYVDAVAGHLAELAPDLSNWPEDAGEFEWFWVYTYKLKPGSQGDFTDAAKAIVDALKEAEWGELFAFTWQLDGDVPAVSLVLPENNWAGFAGPEKSAREIVAEALGEDKMNAMWDAYNENVESAHSTVYHRHEDMSYKGAAK
jgi:hypothetical protein